MPTYRDEAVVLRTHKLGEADRIITMLSRQHGKIRAVAKGVRRTTSKFGARLEPFSHVDLQFATGRTLDVVTQVESLHAFGEPLTGNYPAYTAGQVMLETADRLVVEEGEPAVQQYLLLVGALRVLNAGTADGARAPIADLGLLSAPGARGGRLRAVVHRLRPLWRGRTARGVLARGGGRRLRTVPTARFCSAGPRDDRRCSAPCSRVAGATPETSTNASPARRAGSPPRTPPGTWTATSDRWRMSSVDPNWPPPAEPLVHRPHPVAYVCAVLMPLVLIAFLAAPLGVVWAMRSGLIGSGGVPGASPGAPGPGSGSGQGEAGLGDPYYPNAGNSGYDVAKYQIAISWDPAAAGPSRHHRDQRPLHPAAASRSSSIWRCRWTRCW